MKIKFCGAAREVTGSAHLLTLDNGFRILLDCGLYQGHNSDLKRFNENWLFKPSEIDCVVLSHAHIDHSGRLPKLVRDGFTGPIYSTHATRSLCAIMLLDSAHIQEKDAAYYNKKVGKQKRKQGKPFNLREPLYTREDADRTMDLFVGHPYGKWFHIHPDVEVLYRDAGHILGSASVSLRIKENGTTKMFGFSGDVGRPNRPILRDPQPMPEVDYLLLESTYGDKEHLNAPAEMDAFLQIIKETCVDQGGKLIIPAFSVGRTQEIVYMLDQLETMGKLPHIKVFVDSPLAVNATVVFGTHPECFDEKLNEYMLIDDNPFGFNSLTYVRKVEVSKQLNHINEPCIIISSAGMINAGRVKHHVFNSIDDAKNTILIVGYCAPGTPGGRLRDGVEELKLFGEFKPVRARIAIMDSFSAHADRNELVDFIQNQRGRVKEIFLVHGTLPKQESLQNLLTANGFPEARIPELGESFDL